MKILATAVVASSLLATGAQARGGGGGGLWVAAFGGGHMAAASAAVTWVALAAEVTFGRRWFRRWRILWPWRSSYRACRP